MKKSILYILLLSIIISCGDSSEDIEAATNISKTAHTDTAKINTKTVAKQSNSSLRPVDDFNHAEAIVMAKEFVARRLNISPAPTFDNTNLDWIKLKHNVYKITATVEADDADCVRHKYNWMVKLRYKNGDWTDRNNWAVLDIKITE
ncbi:hypothetical protein [Segetibacter aerophilus]|uniref:Lipoprotein n=1 Tax=Segetibacter aerophilus TaxID=670293 RepID=A0A512BG45_9BACT|nr:hypothetical protein [Segetibacter aerophilus]GEO10931.1 hypothetical protein SAE01_34270 [Segetibacter aerophilus]